jgi:hypothetical protein
MSAQTVQLQSKFEANQINQDKFKEALERKIERSTKSLVKMVDKKDRGVTSVIKPKLTRTRSLSRAARPSESVDDSMDDDAPWPLFPKGTNDAPGNFCDVKIIAKPKSPF